MSILSLRKNGGGVDTDRLTALPEDVTEGKIFLGAGSDGRQVGTMPDHGSPKLTLPVNGKLELPAGKYSGGQVTQAIEMMDAQSVGPGAKQIVIHNREHNRKASQEPYHIEHKEKCLCRWCRAWDMGRVC